MKKKIVAILVAVVLLGVGLFQAVPALASSDDDTDLTVRVSPVSVKIEEGAGIQFVVKAFNGRSLTDVTCEWGVEESDAGDIDGDTGLFVANDNPGTYEDVITVTVTDEEGNTAEASATVTVVDSDDIEDLTRVAVTPSRTVVEPDETVQFSAVGYDENRVVMEGLTFTWTVEGDDNDIDEDGLFTAGETTGTFTVTATEDDEEVTGTAAVKVTDDATDEDQTDFGNRPGSKPGKGNSVFGFNGLFNIFGGFGNGSDFAGLYGGEWRTADKTTEVIFGVVDADGDIEPNDPDGTVIDAEDISGDVIRPEGTELSEGDQVVVVIVNDEITSVMVINSAGSRLPPGLRNNDRANGGQNGPNGWTSGNKSGWGMKFNKGYGFANTWND